MTDKYEAIVQREMNEMAAKIAELTEQLAEARRANPPPPALGEAVEAARRIVETCETSALYEETDDEVIVARALLTTRGDGWQDIETAPKDGSHILGYPVFGPGAEVSEIYWQSMKRESRWAVPFGPPCPRVPILWRPLPLPPKTGF